MEVLPNNDSPSGGKRRLEWQVDVALSSLNFENPIRKIVDTMKLEPNEGAPSPMIKLSIGDPTVFGNYKKSEHVSEAIIEQIKSHDSDGYAPSVGYLKTREAIAAHHCYAGAHITADDVIVTSGCSGALDLIFAAFAVEGKNILLPSPGFSLYKTLATRYGIETRSYNCMPENSWEVDLKHMASLIDANTAAVLITNPSNPCGSNFSEIHVREIVDVANKFKVPIIADEIYGDMVYGEDDFTPMASIKSEVPIIAVGGLAKQWLVPGYRLGWILTYDKTDILAKQFKPALKNLSQLILGACTIVQAAVPAILNKTPVAYKEELKAKLKASAELCYSKLAAIPGLEPVMPAGAMYMMVGFNKSKFRDISTSTEFTEKLVQEQAVFALPGAVFDAPDFFRIVLTVPQDMMERAISRIAEFCRSHSIVKSGN